LRWTPLGGPAAGVRREKVAEQPSILFNRPATASRDLHMVALRGLTRVPTSISSGSRLRIQTFD
jgi:hypothetical protein